VSWTHRFGLTLGLCALFFMLFAGWLGLLPDTVTNLIAAAAVLSLIGLYAVRVAALGIGLGLVVVLFAVNADQATIALGIPAARSGLPTGFWLTNIVPAALVWMAFPIVARLLARRLPPMFSGLAIGLALLTLPALRYINRPDLFIDTYLHPRPGTFAILPVPWPSLVALVTIFATVAVLLLERPQTSLRRAAIGALIAATIVAPAFDAAASGIRLRTSVDVQPSAGGPLTPVTVRASLATDTAPILLWDGQPVTTGAFLEPLRPFVFAGATRADLLPGLEATAPGRHELSIGAGTDRRAGAFALSAPSGLRIVLTEGHVVVSGGVANDQLDLLTIGPAGPELLHRQFDGAGNWRSPLALDPSATFTVIAQSGDAWATLATHQR
jgi:hypothetical protein